MGNILNVIGRFFRSFSQRSLTSIPGLTRIYAWFAFEAYNPSPPSSHAGYTLIQNLPDIKVWRNDFAKKILFAVRGTDDRIFLRKADADYSDLKTDMKLIMNSEQETDRYLRADQLVRTYLREYPGYRFCVVGHSLGGSIAYRLADKYRNLTGGVFNPGVNLDAIRNTQSVASRIKTHIIDGDPVSGILGRTLANTIVYTPFYEPAQREAFQRLPIKEQLYKLHSLEIFPRS